MTILSPRLFAHTYLEAFWRHSSEGPVAAAVLQLSRRTGAGEGVRHPRARDGVNKRHLSGAGRHHGVEPSQCGLPLLFALLASLLAPSAPAIALPPPSSSASLPVLLGQQCYLAWGGVGEASEPRVRVATAARWRAVHATSSEVGWG